MNTITTPTHTMKNLKAMSRKTLDAIRSVQLANKPGFYNRPATKRALILDILTTQDGRFSRH